jgi:hypothetical protein
MKGANATGLFRNRRRQDVAAGAYRDVFTALSNAPRGIHAEPVRQLKGM